MTAAELIRQLGAGGMTQREIARRINRGPSYVSKVATGRKPGGGLEASLRALQRGAGSAHAPRRRTATGRPARLRRPAEPSTADREPDRTASGETTGTLAERIRAGMVPQPPEGVRGFGMRGTARVTYPGSPPRTESVSWSVRAWRDGGGWHDLAAGDAGFQNRPGSVQYVVLDLPVGLRQFASFFTGSFDLADLVAQALQEYGLAT